MAGALSRYPQGLVVAEHVVSCALCRSRDGRLQWGSSRFCRSQDSNSLGLIDTMLCQPGPPGEPGLIQ